MTSRPADSCRATASSTARSSTRLKSCGARRPASWAARASTRYAGRRRLPTTSLRKVMRRSLHERVGSDAREQREDPAEQLLVVGDVVLEDAEALDDREVHGVERLADGMLGERERLESGAAGLRTIRDEHEAEIRPLAACGEEDRALAALILHGHELVDGR